LSFGRYRNFGILAAALIATIDPFEQLNKAQDANVKNTLTEFINANIRYYTTHSALPWNDANNSNAVGCTNLAGGVMVQVVQIFILQCLAYRLWSQTRK